MSVPARCSSCLASTVHQLKDKALVGRDVYICVGCGKPTVQCKRCMPEARSSGSMLHLSGGTSSRPQVFEQGMAKGKTMVADDNCIVCDDILGCWPSTMDDDVTLQRTGSGRMLPGSGRMRVHSGGEYAAGGGGSPAALRGTATLSHTQSSAQLPTNPRKDIDPSQIQALQKKLLKAQRSMLVRIDNKTPHRLLLMDQGAQIEKEVLAGGSWSQDKMPPAVILPNQAVAFGTESLGLNRGGTSARVMYEIQNGAGERIAACQMRWVNPLAQGKLKVWCETKTNFGGGRGPKIERRVPNSCYHSAVTFEIHWATCAEDHFNPDSTNPGGMFTQIPIEDLLAQKCGSSLQHQPTSIELLPEVSVWENQRRLPLSIVGDFNPSLLMPVDPGAWSGFDSDGYFTGINDPMLLPPDCAWHDGSAWKPGEWEYSVSFATSFPRSLYSEFTPQKQFLDMVRRREHRRKVVPLQAKEHKELVAKLERDLSVKGEKTMIVKIFNDTTFPMELESQKVDWGSLVPQGHPRSLIPRNGHAVIAVQGSSLLTGVEGSLSYKIKGTTVFLKYVNPYNMDALGVWVETKTDGDAAAPRLAVKRMGPDQADHSVCEFTIVDNPQAKTANSHYNPAEGIDDGEGVASSTVDGMGASVNASNDALRKYLKKSSRSTLITLTNISHRKLKLVPAETKVENGSWHKVGAAAAAAGPPAEIAPNSVVSFGATIPMMGMSDLKLKVVYYTEPAPGEVNGVWFQQQAGFSLRCVNPISNVVMTGERTFTKYLLGDDTVGLKVAKQDSHAEKLDNNEWSFLITDGETADTIYASRKQDLTARLVMEERSTIVSIANRCKVPMIIQGDATQPFNGICGVNSGKWAERPPQRINPGQTAMVAMKPQMLELTGVGATLKYALMDVAKLEKMAEAGASQEEKSREAGSAGSVLIKFANPKSGDNAYSCLSSGSVFCERLVDPHDVDQQFEKSNHASITFVVEQATMRIVTIGTSQENVKTSLGHDGVLGAEAVAVNEDAKGHPDLFDVKVEQSTGKIIVRRLDSAEGWSHDLKIRARMDPHLLDDEETEGGGAAAGGGRGSSAGDSTVSGFVAIGNTYWQRRGMDFAKAKETETDVEWIKEELGLESKLRTEIALQQACEQLDVPYTHGAPAQTISQLCVDVILTKMKQEERKGIFLSHYQANGGPQIRTLKELLAAECQALQGTWPDKPAGKNEKIWLDIDEKPDTDGMKAGIRRQSCCLIFLTKGYLTRPFCQMEIKYALRYKKTIVLVYETNTEFGYASFGDYMVECPNELKDIFKTVAIPYYTDDVFGKLSRREIMSTCGLLGSQLVDLVATPSELPGPPLSGKILMVANDNDPTAYGQAKNLQRQLLKACPELTSVLELQDGDTLSYTQLPDQFLIFLTDNVFAQAAVCQVLQTALQNDVSLIFVAEADMRYKAVGIPLMGGSLAKGLEQQAPAYIKQTCQGLLTCARPIPFYSVKLFRDESIHQILKEMRGRRPPMLAGRGGSAGAALMGSIADMPDLGPEMFAIIDKMERVKEAALSDKDELLQDLEGQRIMDLQRHELQLLAMREALHLTALWEVEVDRGVADGGAAELQWSSSAGKSWKAYELEQRDTLELAYRKDPKGSCMLDVNAVFPGGRRSAEPFRYQVEFSHIKYGQTPNMMRPSEVTMHQTNLATKKVRQVRRRDGAVTQQMWETETETEPEPSELTEVELVAALEAKRAQQVQVATELQSLEAQLQAVQQQPSEGIPPG